MKRLREQYIVIAKDENVRVNAVCSCTGSCLLLLWVQAFEQVLVQARSRQLYGGQRLYFLINAPFPTLTAASARNENAGADAALRIKGVSGQWAEKRGVWIF